LNLFVRLFLTILFSGYVTNKNALPIKQVNFGRTLAPASYLLHSVGKFECTGRDFSGRMPDSCVDLMGMGHTLNGFYLVKNQNEVVNIYCDFSKLGQEGIFSCYVLK